MTKFRQVWLFWWRTKLFVLEDFRINKDHNIFLMLIIHVVHGICREGCAPVITLSCATGAPLSLLHSAKFYCVSSVQSYLLSPHLHCIHITSTNTVYCTSSTLTCSHPQTVHNIYKRTLQRWNGSHSLCNPAGSLNQACLLHSHYFITKQKFSSPGILKLDHARG